MRRQSDVQPAELRVRANRATSDVRFIRIASCASLARACLVDEAQPRAFAKQSLPADGDMPESRSENLENRGAKLGNLAGGTVRDVAARVMSVVFLSLVSFSRQNWDGPKSLRGLGLVWVESRRGHLCRDIKMGERQLFQPSGPLLLMGRVREG